MKPSASRPQVVWRFADGKRGHENQIDGLIEALADNLQLEVHRLAIPGKRRLRGLRRLFAGTGALTPPDLLIGAGHATHWPILLARRLYGGRSVILMKPTLPMGWFDLCVVPEHDAPKPSPKVFITHGALNRMRATAIKDRARGLLLVGGPSRHVPWRSEVVIHQITSIAQSCPDIAWLLADSRRTPRDFLPAADALALPNLTGVAVDSVDGDWLARELSRAATVWVTEDSASMVFESLTAGAATGILELRGPGREPGSRVLRGVEKLCADGWVTSFSNWRAGDALGTSPAPLDEARRCAHWIKDHWLNAP